MEEFIDYNLYKHLFEGEWNLEFHEEESWSRLKEFLVPGIYFLDIGCQKGIYTEAINNFLKADCFGWCFDVVHHPEIDNIIIDQPHLQFFAKSVGDGDIHSCLIGYDSNTRVSSRTIRLDEFLSNLPRLDLVKMDIDGGELFALRGMINLLLRFKPIILVEIEADHLKTIELLHQIGYIQYTTANDSNYFFFHADNIPPTHQKREN